MRQGRVLLGRVDVGEHAGVVHRDIPHGPFGGQRAHDAAGTDGRIGGVEPSQGVAVPHHRMPVLPGNIWPNRETLPRHRRVGEGADRLRPHTRHVHERGHGPGPGGLREGPVQPVEQRGELSVRVARVVQEAHRVPLEGGSDEVVVGTGHDAEATSPRLT